MRSQIPCISAKSPYLCFRLISIIFLCIMKRNLLLALLVFLGLSLQNLQAQTTLCSIDPVVAGLAPGLYPDSLPPAQGCQFYDQTITFKFPLDTVVSPFGTINFEWFEVDTIIGFPPGNMQWQTNKFPTNQYMIPQDTLGCVRIFGSPVQLNTTATYTLTIRVLAKVDILPTPQIITFNRGLVVFPCQDPPNCFKKTQSQLCEPSLLTFEPDSSLMSNGQPGFSYSWTFGNGQTSTSQFPAVQSYNAGTYYPSLTVTIDTLGYFISSILIQNTNCTDGIGAGDPDYYWILKNGAGQTLVPAGSAVTLTPPTAGSPINTGISNVPVNLGGTYTLEVWDDDAGNPISPSPDGCATNQDGAGAGVNFTISGAGTFQATNQGLTIQYTVVHPVASISCTDTIEIAPKPAKPIIITNQNLSALCEGDVLTLFANVQASGLTWYLDGDSVASGNIVTVTQSGVYTATAVNNFLCESYSDPFPVTFNPKPTATAYVVSSVPGVSVTYGVNVNPPSASYFYGWTRDGAPIGVQPTYTVMLSEPGIYCVTVNYTNMQQCSTTVCVDTVTVGITQGIEQVRNLLVYPNPADEAFTVSLESEVPQDMTFTLYDLLGRSLMRKTQASAVGKVETTFEVQTLEKGIYLLNVETDKGSVSRKVVVE